MLTPQRIDELTDNARRSLARLDATLKYSNALLAERCRKNYGRADVARRLESGFYDQACIIAVAARDAEKSGDVTGSLPQRIAEAMAKGEEEDAERWVSDFDVQNY